MHSNRSCPPWRANGNSKRRPIRLMKNRCNLAHLRPRSGMGCKGAYPSGRYLSPCSGIQHLPPICQHTRPMQRRPSQTQET
eukprot:403953-Pyramimonas_sp.AAC.1